MTGFCYVATVFGFPHFHYSGFFLDLQASIRTFLKNNIQSNGIRLVFSCKYVYNSEYSQPGSETSRVTDQSINYPETGGFTFWSVLFSEGEVREV